MSLLEPRDQFALQSASGWLMLGNPGEALREIEQITPSVQARPEVLMVLWEIHSHARRWSEAIEAADRLIQAAPDEAEGYIKRAYALHELKRTDEAWTTLEPIGTRFPENWLIPYNLACYACQLGRVEDALDLLKRSFRLGEAREIRAMAVKDADLAPLRERIKGLSAPP